MALQEPNPDDCPVFCTPIRKSVPSCESVYVQAQSQPFVSCVIQVAFSMTLSFSMNDSACAGLMLRPG